MTAAERKLLERIAEVVLSRVMPERDRVELRNLLDDLRREDAQRARDGV